MLTFFLFICFWGVVCFLVSFLFLGGLGGVCFFFLLKDFKDDSKNEVRIEFWYRYFKVDSESVESYRRSERPSNLCGSQSKKIKN